VFCTLRRVIRQTVLDEKELKIFMPVPGLRFSVELNFYTRANCLL